MINEDLVAEIQSRYLRGHKSAEIKKDLIKTGLSEKEIDDAISYLHRQALKQVPIIAFGINFWEAFETKVANMTPRVAVGVLASVALLIAVVGVGLYFLLDPLSTQSGSRDEKRNSALMQLQAALDNYSLQRQSYPASLNELMPDYLQSVPKDPRTGEDFEYRVVNGSYELCIKFETKPVECFSGSGSADDSLGNVDMMNPDAMENEESADGFVIDGLVFMDRNNDKVQQAGESGTSSVVAHVADAEGNEICQELTDKSGKFSCDVDEAGVYYVFLDDAPTLEILGVNPQKITVPASSTERSVQVVLRTNVISGNSASSSAPAQSVPASTQ